MRRWSLLAIVPLLILLPLHVALFGFAAAVVHSIYGFMLAIGSLGALFLAYRQFPFACSYVPVENPKLLWPAGLAGVLIVTYGFAGMERWALQSAARRQLGIALGAIAVVLEVVDRANRRERRPVNFEERPALATQRLGLFERVANPD